MWNGHITYTFPCFVTWETQICGWNRSVSSNLILHHFLVFHVICHSFGSYKIIMNNLLFEDFRWKFHNDKFFCNSYGERHNNGKNHASLRRTLIFRNCWDLLLTIWGRITSRACWRCIHPFIFGRHGFSYPVKSPLTSYNSRCRYLCQVIKSSDLARTRSLTQSSLTEATWWEHAMKIFIYMSTYLYIHVYTP